ncbi:hypothetical protein FRC17_001627 [Serendipita sp. 399]|nr:hypothetical protein FRC17_001627 [Serendipita sp. 399]
MSQLPTPGLPRPRFSGIPSGKSGLPAPGIRSRSTTTGASPAASRELPALSSTTGNANSANGFSPPAGKAANTSNASASPDAGPIKTAYGASKQSPAYTRKSISSNGTRASIARPPSSASATSSRHGDKAVPVTPPRRKSIAYGTGSAVRIGSASRSSATSYSVTSRSESRASDLTRNSSRASQRPLEVGDPVKIESLALEGTLRFLGEIAGKPGQWAGVELSGEYAGKGKNDGSVAGVPYFVCPPKCGVFVASAKITAIPIAQSIIRPPSVASSIASPTTNRLRKVSASAQASLVAQSKITAGSRASKYIGITAKQLTTRDLTSSLNALPPPSSPRKSMVTSTSPPQPVTGQSQTTPKAQKATLSFRPRPSLPALATPRPSRAQLSGIKNDMPPPPIPNKEPATPTLSQASNDSSTYVDEPLPDIPNVSISNGTSPIPSPSPSQSGRSSIYATPSPEPSFYVGEMQRLQTQIQSLEKENKELKEKVDANAQASTQDSSSKALLEERLVTSQQKITDLETSLHTSERSGIEKQGKIESLERLVAEGKEDALKARADGETLTREVKAKLEESEALVNSLKGAIDAKASAATENDAILSAKQAEIEVLQGQITRITNDLEQTRLELGGQIHELRKAGQETIALYEERISGFEAERYDMESIIQSLEEKLKAAAHHPSPEELAKQASTAAEIDNETLKEQIAHFQQRISHLEDQLEESQVMAEREEAAIKAKIARYKEKDAQRQQELEEARRLASTTAKSETAARTRIEELEEALRESTTALEDARAEIEALRTDLTNLENSMDPSDRPLETSGTEHAAAIEAKHLKALLEASKLETRATADQLAAANSRAEETSLLVKDLRALIESLEKDKLQKSFQARIPKDDGSKRSRDSTSSISSRTKDDTLRDQVSGLKLMVQELQKENSACESKIRSLETENKLLVTETEDLKEAIKTLEAAIDESIRREEEMLKEEQAYGGMSNDDTSGLQRALREARLELDQIRIKLTDAEKKSAKTIADLNKEVADLESLVEAKIYREDDLEREIERLKDKVQRLQSKSSKSGGGEQLSRSTNRSSHTRSSTVTQHTVAKDEPATLSCEDDGPASTNGTAAAEVYCIDCDSSSHNIRMKTTKRYAVIVHGGAGNHSEQSQKQVRAALKSASTARACIKAAEILKDANATALDAVEASIREMENEESLNAEEWRYWTSRLADSESAEERMVAMGDTVGAIVLCNGQIAAGVSSGGLLLKHCGRVGEAAVYGAGCWATSEGAQSEGIASSVSGTGEQIIRGAIARSVCDACSPNTTDDPIGSLTEVLDRFIDGERHILPDSEDVQVGAVVLHFEGDEHNSSGNVDQVLYVIRP